MSTGGRHGRPIVIAIKQFGESTYTPIAEVEDISGFGTTTAVVTSDGYASAAITKVADPAIEISPGTVRVKYFPAQVTHDATIGLIKWATTDEATTIEIRGPDFSAPDTDVFRTSVDVTGWTRLEPKDDIIRAEFAMTPDGSDLKIDAEIVIP